MIYWDHMAPWRYVLCHCDFLTRSRFYFEICRTLNFCHPSLMTYYKVDFRPKQRDSSNLRLLQMRSKIRRLGFFERLRFFLNFETVTEHAEPDYNNGQEVTPPLTPSNGEKYRKYRRYLKFLILISFCIDQEMGNLLWCELTTNNI